MKNSHSELKITATEMKNTMEGMNSRLLQVEQTVNEVEIRELKNNEAEEQRKRISKNERTLKEPCDNPKQNSICIIWVPEGGEIKV